MIWHHLQRRVHLSNLSLFHGPLIRIRRIRQWWRNKPKSSVLSDINIALGQKPSVILLSAYLQHFAFVREISQLAKQHQIPVIVGGAVFNHDDISSAWLDLPGLTAIVGAESDFNLPKLVDHVINKKDLSCFPGVFLPNGFKSAKSDPLRPLDSSPIPDYTDFPWHRYPSRLIPIMTGRGCQWARCTFCSDIHSVNGRTFRTRTVENVLFEMQEQSKRHQSSNFVFTDIKLNSNPAMLRGISEQIQHFVHGAQWVGTVHVDLRKDNGLSRRDLRDAAKAGMRRVSFGLESGSQRMLDLMDKGCLVEANEEFIRNAYDAGLSVRATMFKGYPGESVHDLLQTIRFLERNAVFIDRIRFNDFSIHTGIPLYDEIKQFPDRFPQIKILNEDHRNGRLIFKNIQSEGQEYRKAKSSLLRLVYQINQKKIRVSAKVFDGVM